MRTGQQTDASADRYSLGIRAYRQGRYRQAIAELSASGCGTDLQGRIAGYYHAMSHRHLGVESLRQGLYEQAQRHLRTAIRTVGPSADLSGYLAACYAKTHRPEQCASELDKAVTVHQHDPALWRQLALAQWQSGSRATAYLTLASALRKFPDASRLHLQLGMFHASEEQYAQARPALQKAADLDCGDADARYYIGLVDAACGDVPAALRAFQRALELRPADLMIAYHLAIAGRAARELGLDVVLRLPENRPSVSADSRSGSLASHIAVEPEFIEAFLDLPPTEMDGELFELLCGAVKMALGSHPAYADLHYHCARLLDRLGKAQEAIAHLERALAINGRYVKARIEMARRQAQAGMTTQALAHLEAAIECGADWPDVHCLAGEILCRLGELPRGRLHLERAMQLNGSYRRAADSLRLLAA